MNLHEKAPELHVPPNPYENYSLDYTQGLEGSLLVLDGETGDIYLKGLLLMGRV